MARREEAERRRRVEEAVVDHLCDAHARFVEADGKLAGARTKAARAKAARAYLEAHEDLQDEIRHGKSALDVQPFQVRRAREHERRAKLDAELTPGPEET